MEKKPRKPTKDPLEHSRRENRTRMPRNQYMRIFIACHGDMRSFARATGLAVQGVYMRLKKDRRMMLIRKYFCQAIPEIAEQNLYSSVMAGDMTASYFALRTLMREKYGEKQQEHNNSDEVKSVTFVLKRDEVLNATNNDSISD